MFDLTDSKIWIDSSMSNPFVSFKEFTPRELLSFSILNSFMRHQHFNTYIISTSQEAKDQLVTLCSVSIIKEMKRDNVHHIDIIHSVIETLYLFDTFSDLLDSFSDTEISEMISFIISDLSYLSDIINDVNVFHKYGISVIKSK